MNNIRIILVSPSHAGNIGSAARAMKNMGLSELFLVNPRYFPHPDANALASRADDVLEQAVVTRTLDEALSGCSLVFGTSARIRTMSQTLLNPREAAENIIAKSQKMQIAIVFGPERIGLTNPELDRCHYHLCIPTVENFSSLNLAAAVQVIVYELRMAALKIEGYSMIIPREPENLATADELEGLYKHIEQTMIDIEFLNPNKPRTMMKRIRHIINRAKIDKDDLNLLRGMMQFIGIGRKTTEERKQENS